MAELLEGQFEIDGVTFGGLFDSVKLESFTPPRNTMSGQAVENQFSVGSALGAQYLRAGTWEFVLRGDTEHIDQAREQMNRVAAAWQKGGEWRTNKLSTLRYRLGNVTRRVYGRGDEFVLRWDEWSRAGSPPVSASFSMADPFFYDDAEREVAVGYAPPVTGGLTAPLSAPLTASGTGATGVGGYIAVVGGTAPTPVVVELHGPTRGALVTGDGWSVQFSGVIAADEVVTVDTRFGSSLVYNNFGRVRNSDLSWKTNLSKAKIIPVSETIRYIGYDPTNTSKAIVKWRPAYHVY